MVPARVLLAEDDPDLRTTLAEILESEGMTVVSVASGSDALSTLAEASFDIVVTDVMMAPPVGLQVAAMARTAGEDVPFLVITGFKEPWIAATVGRLQRAQLLHKPFEREVFVERVRTLLGSPTPADQAEEDAVDVERPAHIFPPALVPLLRERLTAYASCISDVSDSVLEELLTVIFFAGLETEEGQRNPVRVLFVGTSETDLVPAESAGAPLHRWSPMRFCARRSVSTRELVKLAAASASERVFTEVRYQDDDLIITGLAREGVNLEGDRFIKLVVPRPGSLSIRIAGQHVLDYEHGRVQSLGRDVLLSDGPVRRALEETARAAGLTGDGVPAYLSTVDALVGELSSHGLGGILAFSADEHPELPGESGYRTTAEVSLVPLLKRLYGLERNLGVVEQTPDVALEQVLRRTFMSELERVIRELGPLTALDGATVLNRSLGIAGFGIVLPVHGGDGVVEARDLEATDVRPYDLGTKGTRHRAAAIYARDHPGSVVFVASEDGHLTCFFRAAGWDGVVMWRLQRWRLQRR